MHYYQFHIGDYRSSTTHLTNEEDLCYRRLIDFYMDTEQPIPIETEWVARRIRIDIHVVNLVLKDFFIEGQNGWNHDICDKNLEQYTNRANINRINGLKGGRPKKENPMGYESKAKRTLTNNHITNNQEPLKTLYKEVAEKVKSGYPSASANLTVDQIVDRFKKKKRSKEYLDNLLKGIEAYPRWFEKTKTMPDQSHKLLSTFLNQESWKICLEPVKPSIVQMRAEN